MENNSDQAAPNGAQFAGLLEMVDGLLRDFARKEKRGESSYANNVSFDASVWDLKIVFGSLVKRFGRNDIDWHTSVTIPWALTKLLDYYLRVNILFHEKGQGPIAVPYNMVPPINPPTEEEPHADPNAMEDFERISKIHRELFG